jgi:hypothetical protein
MAEEQAASPRNDSTPEPANLDTLRAFTWKVHDYTSELIRFADTKASIVPALSTGIISIFLGARIHLPPTRT